MESCKIFLTQSFEAAEAIADGFRKGKDDVKRVERGIVTGSGKLLLPPQYLARGGYYVAVYTEVKTGGASTYRLVVC